MGTALPDLFDSPAHRLALVLQATRSLIAGLTPPLQDQRSLRLLDFALLNAITDLEEIDTLPPDCVRAISPRVK